MFCTECGNAITRNTSFCTKCGAKQATGNTDAVGVHPELNTSSPAKDHATINSSEQRSFPFRRIRWITVGSAIIIATIVMTFVVILPKSSKLLVLFGVMLPKPPEAEARVGFRKAAQLGDTHAEAALKEIKFALPAVGHKVNLVCEGVLSQATMTISKTALANVTLSHEGPGTFFVRGSRSAVEGLFFDMKGQDNAELSAFVESIPREGQTPENASGSTKWDITNTQADPGSKFNSTTHVVLDEQSGLLHYDRLPLDRKLGSLLDTKYIADCHLDDRTPQQIQADAQMQQEHDNPRLAFAHHLEFKGGPRCNSLRKSAVWAANLPNQRDQDWTQFVDRLMNNAYSLGCLPGQ